MQISEQETQDNTQDSQDVTASSIADDIIDNAPVVRPEIIDALKEEAKANQPESQPTESYSSPASQSTKQEAFNSSIHEVDEQGKPRLTKDGKFRKKRGRGAKQSGAAVKTEAVSSASPVSETIEAPVRDYTATGKLFAGLFFGFTESAIGEEWKPTVTEQEQIELATTRYCESAGVSDIPPGIALCFCVGLYALPRLNSENTKKKLRSLGESLGFVKPTPKPKPVQNVTAPEEVKPVGMQGLRI